jgi:hypothetical protein
VYLNISVIILLYGNMKNMKKIIILCVVEYNLESFLEKSVEKEEN